MALREKSYDVCSRMSAFIEHYENTRQHAADISFTVLVIIAMRSLYRNYVLVSPCSANCRPSAFHRERNEVAEVDLV